MVKTHRVKLFKIFLLFIISSTLLFSGVNTLKKVEIAKGELRLEFNNFLPKKQIKHFALKNPPREVFDFKNTRLSKKNIAKNIKNVKIAQYKSNIVRVVVSSHKPYSCTAYKPILSLKTYHIPLPKQGNVLPAKRYTKSKDKPKKKTSNPKAKKMTTSFSRSHKSELIVIDAGHGGHDTGAMVGGKKEKDLVLMIAKRLEKELKKRGHPVYMTRTRDRFLKLPQRTRIADKKNAVVFISIHANSVPKRKRNKIQGVETFFLQNTRDARSQRIAARENKSVLKGTSKLSRSVILDSVLSGPKIVQSNKLAIDVHRRMITNLRSRYSGVKDGGVRHAPFWVLVGASRPSILVEVGYISHPKERKRLFMPRYQELIAKGIAEGVDNYLDNRKKEIDF
ncbi:N-acetylmuramoyl-L-alanine amidase [Sulfurovum sp. CS9]|uniref:N-acetylmuramoyl-L-alanine amidase n=1 Tax=Sulfurovum sp. CS9 TaxID=3391146 RepID=UPI0039E9CDD6